MSLVLEMKLIYLLVRTALTCFVILSMSSCKCPVFGLPCRGDCYDTVITQAEDQITLAQGQTLELEMGKYWYGVLTDACGREETQVEIDGYRTEGSSVIEVLI